MPTHHKLELVPLAAQSFLMGQVQIVGADWAYTSEHFVLLRCRFIVGVRHVDVHRAFRTCHILSELPGFLSVYLCLTSAYRTLFPPLVSTALLSQYAPFDICDVFGKFGYLRIFSLNSFLQRVSKGR